MKQEKRVGVVGGGSWATAIAKMLLSNSTEKINWYLRSPEKIERFQARRHNPDYLTDVTFDVNRINFYSDINEIVAQSEVLIFAVPSPFLKGQLEHLTEAMSDKFVISAIKGIVPEDNLIIGSFFNEHYQVPINNVGVIAGPCHAEEVALERLSYLTTACSDMEKAAWLSSRLSTSFIKANPLDDIYGIEYSSVMKNVVAICAGIVHGLRYGDNFQAVLISNAIQEIRRFVDRVHPLERDINNSAYLGDLLVTCYSQFSRNRNFGLMLGQGYSVKSAQLEMSMIAEGYYGVKCITEINAKYQVDMPITNAVYKIIYEKSSPRIEIRQLTEKIR